jgi:Tol biopolymer transport system component
MRILDSVENPLYSAGDPAPYGNLRYAPDSARLAFTLHTPRGGLDVYVHDLRRGVTVNVTSHPSVDGHPVWSPDETRIAFASWRDGTSNLYLTGADGAGGERALLQSNRPKYPTVWSSDGSLLLFEIAQPDTGWDIFVLPLKDGPEPYPCLRGRWK